MSFGMLLAAVALAGCGDGGGSNATQVAVRPAAGAPVLVPAKPVAVPTVARRDPASAEAARDTVLQLVEHVRRGQLKEAERLLTPALRQQVARAGGAERLARRYRNLSVELGGASAIDGAAGSTFVNFPVCIRLSDRGRPGNKFGSVTLRRVNDVPGATAEERRWRLDRVVAGLPRGAH